MHPNPVFHDKSRQECLEFARTRAFGVLSVNGDNGPLLAHVPFLLSGDGAHADLHLVRSNPIARALRTPLDSVIAVSGPDGYVSPDWYGIEDQVPTWNYSAVHLRGRLEVLPDDALRGVLERQSEEFEARLAPKPPWAMGKVSDDALARMMRMIQPVRLHVDAVDGTWKYSQNKSEDARIGAADGVSQGFGQDVAQLGDQMRRWRDR